MAKSSVKHRAISVRQGNNLAILAHKTGINRPASTYACVWKKIQGEADRHETDPPPPRSIYPAQNRHMRRRTRVLAGLVAVLCFGGLLAGCLPCKYWTPAVTPTVPQPSSCGIPRCPPARGEIYSADGVTLAASKTCWTIRASPRELADGAGAARRQSAERNFGY